MAVRNVVRLGEEEAPAIPGADRLHHLPPLRSYWHEDALIDFAISKGIVILSYAPLAKGAANGLLNDPAILAVAAAHGVTPAQAALKWNLQRTQQGVVLPRSTNSSHMAENLAVASMAWSLTAAEMASLAGLPQKKLYGTSCYPYC